MKSKPHKAAVIMPLNKRKEMLLQKKDMGYLWHPGSWCFFGGKIEKGESPEEALRREIGEEIGEKRLLENIAHFDDFPFMDTRTDGEERSGIIHVYSARFIGNVSDIRLREGAGFGFFSRQEMGKLDIIWHNYKVIDTYYDSLLRQG